MLASIVGNVDTYSAAVLVFLWIATAACVVSFIVNYRSKQRLQLQYEIDRQKLANEDVANKRTDMELNVKLARIALEKDVQFRRIETGLIEAKVETGRSGGD